ncbi:MAG: DUF4178 domain-containing protein [Pseudanabaena sp. ELA607]
MPSVFTQVRLQQLRAGDRVHYKGVTWAVQDFSTYADQDEAYATMEWLLSSGSQEIYLLREVDPEDVAQANAEEDIIPEEATALQKLRIRWYVSTELRLEQVLVEPSGDDLRYSLWNSRKANAASPLEPYPELMALGELYYFADQTAGIYHGEDGELNRCTWDYWNQDHSLNLALELWANDEVHVYSTTPVSPELFSDVEINGVAKATGVATITQGGQRAWQWITAWSMVIVGVFLMLFGGW